MTRSQYRCRQIHFHVGPTNSGKTQHAIEILKRAERGCYLAPLRLLATQVHGMLTEGERDPSTGLWKDGLLCDLKTGPVREIVEGATHLAATVELASYDDEYDVAVIDEIQMINDPDRGAEWTLALLGVKAQEVHLCGDERSLKLVADILARTEDELTVHRYSRLSPLITEDLPFRSWEELREGDCIVDFSKRRLFEMRNAINDYMNRDAEGNLISNDNHCAIIYGTMPPKLKQQ